MVLMVINLQSSLSYQVVVAQAPLAVTKDLLPVATCLSATLWVT